MPGRRYSKYIHTLFLVFDLLILDLSFVLSYLFVFKNLDHILDDRYILLFILYNLVWILASNLNRLYQFNRFSKSENVISKLTKATILFSLILLSFVFTIKLYFVSRYMVIYSLEIFYVLAVLFRLALIPLLSWFRKSGYNYRTIIIVGAGSVGVEVMKAFTTDLSIGLRFLGFFDDNPEACKYKSKIIGKVEDAKAYALNNQVDEVIVALPDVAEQKIQELIRFCENNLIRIRIVPDFYRYFKQKVHIDFYESIPFMYIREEPLQSLRNRLLKRAVDLVFSSLVILLIFPWFIPIVGLIIKLNSRGPLFFKQDRSGLNNKVFRMWKFRTMVVNIDSDLVQATRNDRRITPVGRFLRKTNLDEFPQFLNIFTGNMSVVGPRPHMLKHTTEYSKIIDKFMVRHFVKPGLTGWAQVTGFRGETGKPELMAKRVEQDVWYIENWTLLLDFRIIFMTIRNMIFGDPNAV